MTLEVIVIGLGGPGLGSGQVLQHPLFLDPDDSRELFPALGTRIDFIFHQGMKPKVGEVWVVEKTKKGYELKISGNQVQFEIIVDWEGRITGPNLPPIKSAWQAVQIDWASSQPWGPVTYIKYTPTPAGKYSCNIVEANLLCFLTLTEPADLPAAPDIINNINSQIELAGAIFNWQTGEIKMGASSLPEISSSTAIKMLRPVAPEFPLMGNSVVAYPIDQMGSTETIYCCFRTANMDLELQVVNVRAILQGWPNSFGIANTSFSFCTADLQSLYLYSSYSILDSNALYEGFIPFEINTGVITNQEKAVGEYQSDWLWQSTFDDPSSQNSVWHNIQRMPVITCLTLRQPQYPWATGHFTVFENIKNNTYPFERLLRIACRWAAGARNEFDAVKKITEHLLTSPLFVYRTSASTFTVYNVQEHNTIPISPCEGDRACVIFNANKLNEVMEGMNGSSIPVDCVDLSHIVMLLANSIGCNIKLAILYDQSNPGSAFCVNPIIPLGSDEPNAHYNFSFHQVAYLGNIEDGTAQVFDPCFRLYSDDATNPTLGTPIQQFIEKLASAPSIIGIQQESCREIIQII